ncbi:MAG: ABC-2 type transport system ATP-binding protein [Patiriisocius sp.]|jgi:ABC-2 type transport system ATP-binding protein
MRKSTIEVKNITKLYGSQRALSDVSFSISNGEIVGFLGPNGAGKSTMMKILTTYIKPTYGDAFVSGHNVLEDEQSIKKIVGYLPEHNPLYVDMYVKEYLGFVAGLYKLPKKTERVKEMIDMVGLEVEQHKKIGALSKGYRQRVGLAQAMIHDPKVLILDEPTSGLDPNQLVEVRALIQKVGKEKTVMLSTHIMQEVEAICTRVIIINNGELVTDKGVAEVVNDKQAKTLEVEFSGSVDKNKLRKIPGVLEVYSQGNNTWSLTLAEEDDIRQSVFSFAVENEVAILTQKYTSRSLEDAFKDLTKK